MNKELQNLLDNYEQVIYGYAEPIIPSIHQIHLLLDYISQLDIKVKKQKEVIDKAINDLNIILDIVREQPLGSDCWIIDRLEANKNILKEVE